MKYIKDFIIVCVILFALLLTAIYGAKRPIVFDYIYAKAKAIIGIDIKGQAINNRGRGQPRGARAAYKAKGIMDLPSRINPNLHQEYLAGLREKYRDNLPLPKMIKINGGKFNMGCQSGQCIQRELPVHEVNVPDFAMAATEVTFELWDTCIAMGGCYTMPGDLGFGRGDRPVFLVNWDEVTYQFLPWLNANTDGGFRLPSEAEWEYAARAGTTSQRYWGNEEPSCDPDSPFAASWGAQPWWERPQPCPNPGTSVPVASFKPNPWGLYDMLGSVHEWTNDCENSMTYEGAPTDGSAWRDSVCSRIAVRGGAWTSDVQNMRVSNRKIYDKSFPFERVGFRLVREL